MSSRRRWAKTLGIVLVLVLSVAFLQQVAKAARLSAVSRISFVNDGQAAASFLSFDPFSLKEDFSAITPAGITGANNNLALEDLATTLQRISTHRPPIRVPFRPPLRSPFRPPL